MKIYYIKYFFSKKILLGNLSIISNTKVESFKQRLILRLSTHLRFFSPTGLARWSKYGFYNITNVNRSTYKQQLFVNVSGSLDEEKWRKRLTKQKGKKWNENVVKYQTLLCCIQEIVTLYSKYIEMVFNFGGRRHIQPFLSTYEQRAH